MLRTLSGIAVAVLTSSCFFDLGRGVEHEAGEIAGRAVEEIDAVWVGAQHARLVPEGGSRILRARASGEFVVRGLAPGGWTLRLARDANGDGLPERAAVRSVRLSVERHAAGLFGESEPRLTWVQLGEVPLDAVAEVSGTVTREDDGAAVAGAQVYAFRAATLPEVVLSADGTTRPAQEVLLGAEAVTASDATGAFRFPALASGDLSIAAFFEDDDGQRLATNIARVSAAPGDRVEASALALSAVPDTRVVRLELSPEPEVGERVKVVLTRPSEALAEDAFDSFGRGLVFSGGPSVDLDVGVGVWDVYVGTDTGRRAVLPAQVAPTSDGLVVWGVAAILGEDPCATEGGARDCDGDGIIALPAIPDVDGDVEQGIWEACAASCGDAFGDEGARSCEVAGVEYDCDDDGDGQPEVTEPQACVGLTGGRDSDGDGACDFADPYPQCAENDPGAAACAAGRSDDPRFPEVREEYGGPPDPTGDAGPSEDAGVDAGVRDAGVDSGPMDGGPLDAGPVDAGGADAGAVGDLDAGVLEDGLGTCVFTAAAGDVVWGEYLANDAESALALSGAPCAEDPPTRDGCVHAGELVVFDVAGRSSCAGLSATDELGAFDWACDDGSGTVRVYSTGLAEGAGLRDLVDFDTGRFLPNSVTVLDGATPVLTTPSEPWHNNAVCTLSRAGSLGRADTLYLVTDGSVDEAFRVAADGVTLVIDPAVTLEGAPDAGAAPATDGGRSAMVYAEGVRRFWLEGALDARGFAQDGVVLRDVTHSRLRNVDVIGRRIHLANADGNRLEHVGVAMSDLASLLVGGSDDNFMRDIRVARGNGPGLYLANSNRNVVTELNASNLNNHGVRVRDDSSRNSFVSVVIANNRGGASVAGTENFFANWLIANGYNGVGMNGGKDTAFSLPGSDNVLMNYSQTAFEHNGLSLGSERNVFVNFASYEINYYDGNIIVYDPSPYNTSHNYMTGRFVLQGVSYNDCWVGGAPSCGIDSGCRTNATKHSSDFVREASAAASWGASFVDLGSTAVDTTASPAVWIDTPSFLENLGKGGANWPHTGSYAERGRCTADTCYAWNWALSSADTHLLNRLDSPLDADFTTNNNGQPVLFTRRLIVADQAECEQIPGAVWTDACTNPGLLDQTACETQLTEAATWGPLCIQPALRHAVERFDDGVGNDDGLCESDETCIYTPNLTAYQGHGALVELGVFNGTGGLEPTNVTLLAWDENGY